MTLEDIAAFWKAYNAEIILGLIAATVSFLFGLLSRPRPLRQAWKHKSRIKRLEDEIALFDKRQENPVRYFAYVMRSFIARQLIIFLGFAFSALLAVTSHPTKLTSIGRFLDIATYGTYFSLLTIGSIQTYYRLRRVSNPIKYRSKLVERLEKLKERGY